MVMDQKKVKMIGVTEAQNHLILMKKSYNTEYVKSRKPFGEKKESSRYLKGSWKKKNNKRNQKKMNQVSLR